MGNVPAWKQKVQVGDLWRAFDEAGYPESGPEFRTHRDAVVERFKASKWYENSDPFGELHDLIEEWEDVDNLHYFNLVLNGVYDLADDERVWIETIR